uniref:RGS domain-containing protein n=1 Tax=Acrobeloides nanus TaxID=290746 RepID=A0A914EFB6_9BILA
MAPWQIPSTSETNDRAVNILDYTSSSSSSGPGREYKRHYRFTLPSITTSDTTGSEISNECRNGANVDYNYLYADPPPKIPEDSVAPEENKPKGRSNKENGTHHEEKFVRPVRRVQSFATERDTLTKRKQERKKSNFGPISRTFHFLKHKIDSAMSTSTLYPSHEEVRQWSDSFEALINHKYGCLLFKAFLKTELSEENLRFWFEVEEFKKLKNGKKSTLARAHQIYDEYIREQAPNEVNLDSATKAATKAALESGAKPDTFNLAQARIEQLMSKDSYPRFVKSPLYLNLLNGEEEQHRLSQASIASAGSMVYNCESKRGSAASDTGTMIVHLESPKHVVLVE